MTAHAYVHLPVHIETTHTNWTEYAAIRQVEWDAMSPVQREQWAEEAARNAFHQACSYRRGIVEESS